MPRDWKILFLRSFFFLGHSDRAGTQALMDLASVFFSLFIIPAIPNLG